MATRTANLSFQHVEALNLVETEFSSGKNEDNEVVSAWKLYLSHLNDKNYPQEAWGARRADLLVDLLHEMSRALGYGHDKAAIKAGSYYPQGYIGMEEDQQALRKGWLAVLYEGQPINMKLTSSEEAANLQRQVNEAIVESLSDKRIVKVLLIRITLRSGRVEHEIVWIMVARNFQPAAGFAGVRWRRADFVVTTAGKVRLSAAPGPRGDAEGVA